MDRFASCNTITPDTTRDCRTLHDSLKVECEHSSVGIDSNLDSCSFVQKEASLVGEEPRIMIFFGFYCISSSSGDSA
jgi:hypothetical protein